MKKAGLILLYILSQIIHYCWPILISYLLYLINIRNIVIQIVIMFLLWMLTVILGHGCPFSYLNQWISIQLGWKKDATYTFRDCLLYKYGLLPIERLIKKED